MPKNNRQKPHSKTPRLFVTSELISENLEIATIAFIYKTDDIEANTRPAIKIYNGFGFMLNIYR